MVRLRVRGSLWGCETGYLVVVQRTRFAVVLLENKEQINVVCFTETILRNSHQCHYGHDAQTLLLVSAENKIAVIVLSLNIDRSTRVVPMPTLTDLEETAHDC